MLLLLHCLRRIDANSFFNGLETLLEADTALLHVSDGCLQLESEHTDKAGKADADSPRNRLEILILF